MKYRVKFKCYWYNTGAADNHHYDNFEDFDTIEEATEFKKRVDEQLEMNQKWERSKITYDEYDKWKNNFQWIGVENGFIEDYGKIVKYYPEREETI